MSIIEAAISRMRQADAAKKGAETIARRPASPEPPADPATESALSIKRLTIDFGMLRAKGYLPEESTDRQIADHYRQIKRPLIDKALSNQSGGPSDFRLIMVTSALPGDGKTFTSINLALSIAREHDVTVLLVDADTPRPHLSEIFDLQGHAGLMDALVDETQKIESLIMPTNIRGLSLLPAGTPVEGTAELINSDRMRQLVVNLTANNPRRIVILDSPPLLITSESRALAKITGQILLVVRAGDTPQHAVRDAIALFGEQQAGGIVLNQGHAGFAENYYGYGAYGSERVDTAAKR
jgi:exopolysaccharide/PEP-CTERM locus tyrosine autokinase